MTPRFLVFLPALAVLAACGGTGSATSGAGKAVSVKSAPSPATRPPTSVSIRAAPGLEGVIGASADQLVREFGPPRLDVLEGEARKLQWSGPACILDVYLYPPAQGERPVGTYLDARRGDGRDVDRVACIAALRQP